MTTEKKMLIGQFLVDNTPEQFLEQYVNITDLYMQNQENLNKDLNNKDRFDSTLYYINEAYNKLNVLMKLIAISAGNKDALERISQPIRQQQQTQNINNTKQQQQSTNTSYNGDINKEESKTPIVDTKSIKEESNRPSSVDTTMKIDKNEESSFDDLFEDMIVEELPEDDNESNVDDTMITPEEEYDEYDDEELDLYDILQEEILSLGFEYGSYTYNALMSLYEIPVSDDMIENGMDYDTAISEVAKLTEKPKRVVGSTFSNAVKKANFDNSKYINFKKYSPQEITKELMIQEIFNLLLESYR